MKCLEKKSLMISVSSQCIYSGDQDENTEDEEKRSFSRMISKAMWPRSNMKSSLHILHSIPFRSNYRLAIRKACFTVKYCSSSRRALVVHRICAENISNLCQRSVKLESVSSPMCVEFLRKHFNLDCFFYLTV